ncbi:hypothetical protein CALCODRAFT_505616 [Calocera cornea HHB12733]|uniref:Uncharacterized protein n=1 Tax=Calocera cornea HHB12733 TaxID=1353952 RepID=A0A165JU43_9BASI|nr:hypothetical protein CALCODRAFT_505616 [Calocera cornea HHB12733]
MSASCTPSATPSPHVEPLHHPEQAALQPRKEPLSNVTNNVDNQAEQVSLGQKALLANRMAKHNNPKMISPTDNFMTPVSAKLSQVKKKHFGKGKPTDLANKFSMIAQSPTVEMSEGEATAQLTLDGSDKREIDF